MDVQVKIGEAIILLIRSLVFLLGGRLKEFRGKHLLSGPVPHLHENTFLLSEGVYSLGSVPPEALLVNIGHIGSFHGKDGLRDHRIFHHGECRFFKGDLIGSQLRQAVEIGVRHKKRYVLRMDALGEVEVLGLIRVWKGGGYGPFMGPTSGRRNECKLTIWFSVMIRGIVKPYAIT